MSKTYDSRTIRHEEARHALARLVHRMGFVWNDHHIEAGIDALIEITEPTNGKALGAYVGVQVKTVLTFQSENDIGFSFSVDAADLAYWLGAKLPVLLIVGRPAQDEFFAIHVQDYFGKPDSATGKTVRFIKDRDRFTADEKWQRTLHAIGGTFTRGMSWPPKQQSEVLVSNLLRAELPKFVYSAPTGFKDRRDLIAKLKTTAAATVREVIIKEDKVWSPANVGDPLWGNEVVDREKVTVTPFRDLAFHTDLAKRRYAVELLTLSLNARLLGQSVHWINDAEMHVFVPDRVPNNKISREVKSNSGTSKQGVFFPTYRKGKLTRCRHAAMTSDFVTIGQDYYLQINPTCFFSTDGRRQHPKHEELLQGLKIMQKQRDFLRGLFLWRTILTQTDDFFQADYPHLVFHDYLQLDAHVSVPDDVWLRGGTGSEEVGEDDVDRFL